MSEREVASRTQERNHARSARILPVATPMIMVNAKVVAPFGMFTACGTHPVLRIQPANVLFGLNPVTANVRAPITFPKLARFTPELIALGNATFTLGAEAQGIGVGQVSASMKVIFVLP